MLAYQDEMVEYFVPRLIAEEPAKQEELQDFLSFFSLSYEPICPSSKTA